MSTNLSDIRGSAEIAACRPVAGSARADAPGRLFRRRRRAGTRQTGSRWTRARRIANGRPARRLRPRLRARLGSLVAALGIGLRGRANGATAAVEPGSGAGRLNSSGSAASNAAAARLITVAAWWRVCASSTSCAGVKPRLNASARPAIKSNSTSRQKRGQTSAISRSKRASCSWTSMYLLSVCRS